MIDRAVLARPGLSAGLLGRGSGERWWQGWFAPSGGRRGRVVDVLLALVIAFCQIVGTIDYSSDQTSPWALDGFAYVLLSIGPVALLFRRRWPEATLVVAFAAAAGYAATGYPRGPIGYPAFALALGTVIMMGSRRVAWGALPVVFLAFALLPSVTPDQVEEKRNFFDEALVLVWLPFVAGGSELARVRGERRVERARAEQQEARRRASEERLRIARELHDVLAHNISLISVQSGVMLHLLDERPDRVRAALEAINEASEEALRELRSVLDVLSGGLGEDGASGEWAPLAPTAGLGDLDGLVRRTRAAGVDVHVVVEGHAEALPTEVDLAALRIVQEALTNVVRHAGRDVRAAVRVAYSSVELVVQIDDDGAGASRSPALGAGRGIAGMRERVNALGGTVEAGPRVGRGFRVRARLPR
jgi:signal transduction histidine kinase